MDFPHLVTQTDEFYCDERETIKGFFESGVESMFGTQLRQFVLHLLVTGQRQ